MAKSFFSLVTELETLLGQLNTILAGADDETVEVNGVTKDSISKAIKDSFSSIRAMVQGRESFETKAIMDLASSYPKDTIAEVWNDPTRKLNGTYVKQGEAGESGWTKSKFDFVNMFSSNESKYDLLTKVILDSTRSSGGRDSHGHPWSVTDSNGRVAIALNELGEIITSLLNQNINFTTRDFQRFIWSIQDRDNNVSVGVTQEGHAFLDLIEVDPPLKSERVSGLPFLWSIFDENGHVSISIDKYGQVDLLPSSELIKKISDKLPLSDIEILSDFTVFNIREFTDYAIASVQESDLRVYDIKQLKKTDSTAALINKKQPLIFSPVSGQSNSGSGGSTGVSSFR